jgi:hypothetical protein
LKSGALLPSAGTAAADSLAVVVGGGDFAGFAVGLDAVTVRFAADAASVRGFPAFAFAVSSGFVRGCTVVLPARDVLEDLLGNSFDIRLPFVAFGGSIIRVFRVVSGAPDKTWQLLSRVRSSSPRHCLAKLGKSQDAVDLETLVSRLGPTLPGQLCCGAGILDRRHELLGKSGGAGIW